MISPKHNPFRAAAIHALPYQPTSLTLPQILSKLKSLNYRAAITGPHGTGKSTCLKQLNNQLLASNFQTLQLTLNQSNPKFNPAQLTQLNSLTPNHILLLDGAEQLSPLKWRKFLKSTTHLAGLIITTHKPHRLPTLFTTTTSLDLLTSLTQQLTPLTPQLQQNLPQLFNKHAGNIRDIFHELYLIYANQPQNPS